MDQTISFENVIGKIVCPPNETLIGDQCVNTLKTRVKGSCLKTKSYEEPQGMSADVALDVANSINLYMSSNSTNNQNSDAKCFRQGILSSILIMMIKKIQKSLSFDVLSLCLF